MPHHRLRAVGLIALLALLVFAPGATAATAAKGAAKAKVRAYGKHCKGKGADRAKCLEAMSRLATGKSSSPQVACRLLSRKKVKGERKSAYARCVSEGKKLMRSKRGKGAWAGDDGGSWGDDPDPADDGDGAANDDDGDDGSAAGDPDDLDPYGDAGAGGPPPAADDVEPGDDDGRAQS